MLLGEAIGARAIGDPRDGARPGWGGPWHGGVRPWQGVRVAAGRKMERPGAEGGSRIR